MSVTCPRCRLEISGARNLDFNAADISEAGITVCVHCGVVCWVLFDLVDRRLRLQPISEDEMVTLSARTLSILGRMQDTVRKAHDIRAAAEIRAENTE